MPIQARNYGHLWASRGLPLSGMVARKWSHQLDGSRPIDAITVVCYILFIDNHYNLL